MWKPFPDQMTVGINASFTLIFCSVCRNAAKSARLSKKLQLSRSIIIRSGGIRFLISANLRHYRGPPVWVCTYSTIHIVSSLEVCKCFFLASYDNLSALCSFCGYSPRPMWCTITLKMLKMLKMG